jgi:hypothetical protein
VPTITRKIVAVHFHNDAEADGILFMFVPVDDIEVTDTSDQEIIERAEDWLHDQGVKLPRKAYLVVLEKAVARKETHYASKRRP